ncbi:MAG: hypothetical protein K6A44_00590 [bacterium]|nr:hypothetical protein [bacterium]
MGLAASQARYLALTARKSDLEFQSQTINTRRIQLAYRTAEIAQAYTEGMNNKRISISSTNEKGDTIWNEATFGNLLKSGYVVIPICGAAWSSISEGQDCPYLSDDKQTGDETVSYSPTEQMKEQTWTGQATLLDAFDGLTAANIGNYFEIDKTESATDNTKWKYKLKSAITPAVFNSAVDSVKNALISNTMNKYTPKVNGAYAGDSDNRDLQTLLSHGLCQIITQGFYSYLRENGYTLNGGISRERFYELQDKWESEERLINPTGQEAIMDWRADQTDTFSQRSYTEDDADVLARYERDTAEVQAQDKVLEAQEKNIETQHKAIETELEAIQKVIQNNIEKTFKIFS